MKNPPLPDNEDARLAELKSYEILDTESEEDFDDITYLASFICETPIALISLVDEDRQWFKSKVGLETSETPRDDAFCSHTILQGNVLEVPDTTLDERFADNPLVTSPPNIRYYLGFPLRTPNQLMLGSLCVIDRVPRKLSDQQMEALRRLSHQVMVLLDYRRSLARLARQLAGNAPD